MDTTDVNAVTKDSKSKSNHQKKGTKTPQTLANSNSLIYKEWFNGPLNNEKAIITFKVITAKTGRACNSPPTFNWKLSFS